jgi:hypothetical protein
MMFKTESDRVWLKGVLLEGPVKVTFVKKDGTDRLMTCTLNTSLIPAPVEKVLAEGEVKVQRKVPVDSLSVYDLENRGWRAFQYESIRKIQLQLV